jgi:hypothetical protein
MPEPEVQRQVEPEEGPEEEMLQRQESRADVEANASPNPSAVPAMVQSVLNSPGHSLDADTRSFMEPRFGLDLSHIQVHTDDIATRSAQAVQASAYTIGNHIAFGTGHYQPQTISGKRLIAHELVHTLQQSKGSGLAIQRQIKIPVFDEFDPCIQVEDQQICGSDAKKACEKVPAIPGCDTVCRIFGCDKPKPPDFSCPPGFKPGQTSDFKGQCCPQGITAENASDCCPASRIPVNASSVRCCPPDTLPDAERKTCVTTTPPSPQPLCLPGETPNLFGECCRPGQIMDSHGRPCSITPPPPPPPTPTPTPLPAATEIFFKLDRPLPGATGSAAFQASTTSQGQANFSTLVAQLQQDPTLQVQLIGRASPEGPAAYNQALGERRANLIVEELVRSGIAASRMSNPPTDDLRSECQEIRPGIVTCGEAGASGEGDRQVLARVFQAAQAANP